MTKRIALDNELWLYINFQQKYLPICFVTNTASSEKIPNLEWWMDREITKNKNGIFWAIFIIIKHFNGQKDGLFNRHIILLSDCWLCWLLACYYLMAKAKAKIMIVRLKKNAFCISEEMAVNQSRPGKEHTICRFADSRSK